MYMEIVDPKNQDKRNKWDKTFVEHEILQTYPDNKGVVRFMRYPISYPLWDRSFFLYTVHLQKKSTGSARELLSRSRKMPGIRQNWREMMAL